MPPKNRPPILQNIIDDFYPAIAVSDDILESKITKELLDDFLSDTPTPRIVGLAPAYSPKGTLTHLIISVQTRAIAVQFHSKNKGANAYCGREILADHILCNPDVTLAAFDLPKIALALFPDQNIRLVNGVDLQDAAYGADRDPLATIKFAIEDRAPVLEENVPTVFASTSNIFDAKRIANIVIQAWVAQCICSFDVMEARIQDTKRINTKDCDEEVRGFFELLHSSVHSA